MIKNKKLVLGILLLIIAAVVFVSGCVQEEAPPSEEKECEVKEDCQDNACFTKECVDNKCSYFETIPCCGNEICETETYLTHTISHPIGESIKIESRIIEKSAISEPGETYSTCPQDCPNPKDELEEKIPEIKEYPKLGQVLVNLYADEGFTDSEIKYIKSLFEIFKLKTNLHQADEEVLAYLVTDKTEGEIISFNNYPDRDMHLDYFVEEIIPLANSITKGSSGDTESIEKIVSWTRENIDVDWTAAYIIGQDTPKAILENKKVPTPCDYWATLITVLCRASGIPAREVSGGFAEDGPGHDWIEAYVNREWISVDSTGYMEENLEKQNWLHSAFVYDPLNNRLMDVSLTYNRGIVDLIIEHTKEVVGETSATKQAEEIFTQYEKESDIANQYVYAQDIMDICISEIIAEEGGYESEDIKVLNLWDWDKLKKEEAFLSELEKAKVISVYDVTAKGLIWYKGSGSEEFPLEKIDTVILEIKQHFQGEIYFFLAHYWADCGPLSDAVTISLFDPKDVDTLETAYQNLSGVPVKLIKNFIMEIVSVVSKEKNSTTFHFPEEVEGGAEYSIVTGGSFDMENTAFDITLNIDSMIIIQDIMMVFKVGQTEIIFPELNISEQKKWNEWRGGFDNFKLIDKEGKVYADPEVYRNPRPDPTIVTGPPYNCEDAPGGIFISPGQTLEIYREDDLVIIKGDMTTEHTVIS
ncbi:MAG: transglutaminase-like domain-containing protein [Candidatus Diapherotrites archaeon]